MKVLKNRLKPPIALMVILFLGLILRLINLGQSFWLDEGAQVIESSRSLWQQFDLAADFHPPLYHLLLHFWMLLGKSEVIIRIPSVLFGVLSVFLIYKIACRLGSKNAGFLAALFLAVSPYHIWYSQEARPYSLFIFLSSLLTFLWIRKIWKIYTVVAILLLYTHYFASFVLLSHLVATFIFDKKSLKMLVFSLFLSLIAFLPWLPSFVNQLRLGTGGFFSGWTGVVSENPVKAIPLTLAKFIFGKGSIDNNIFYAVVILPVFIIFIFSIVTELKKRVGQLLLVLFFTPFLLVVAVAFLIPIIAPQRLIFLLPFFLLILSYGIFWQPKRWQLASILIVLVTFSVGIYQYYFDRNVQREDWRSAVEYVERQSNGKDLVLFVFPDPFAPYLWYHRGNVQALGIAPDFIIKPKDLDRLEMLSTDKNKIYLFDYLTGLTDSSGLAKNRLEMLGYINTETANFPGVGFVHIYDRK